MDKYYVGQTIDLLERLHRHNHFPFRRSYTKRASDW
ncbi:MAG: hypothetical protein JNN04_09970 [Cyclobacteriaceae bacterium]|nr:hypothetical protein [Cyclobacteriaceae bacterium]